MTDFGLSESEKEYWSQGLSVIVEPKKMFIGIDPGLTGAIAIIKNSYDIILHDAPVLKVKKSNKTKTEFMPHEMAAILDEYKQQPAIHCYIEQVNAMPKQGVISVFGFGKGYGIWLGILAAYQIPFTLVSPNKWKRDIMKGVADKNASRMKAQQLFPSVAGQLARSRDDGRAEALLIAEWGRNYEKN